MQAAPRPTAAATGRRGTAAGLPWRGESWTGTACSILWHARIAHRMKILVAGAGPAGLYFSYLAKRRHPDWRIRVLEQNPADATFGFGVVFSDKALEFLRADDPETYELITPQMESWTDLTVIHRRIPVVIDGIGFAAIGRLHLLRLLRQQAASVGVAPEYESPVSSMEGYDLVVAADGANSAVRRAADFRTRITQCTNKFAWYGTRRRFETLTQTFVRNEHGSFNAHHYRHAPGDGGRHRARQGTAGKTGRERRAGHVRGSEAPHRRKAGSGGGCERRLVRPLCRTYEPVAARLRLELYSEERAHRSRAPRED